MPKERGRNFDIKEGVVEIAPWLKFMSGKKVPFREIQSGTIWGVESLISPVVGLTLNSEKWDIIFEETSRSFRNAMAHFQMEQKLPADWYLRAERGERFHLDLTEH